MANVAHVLFLEREVDCLVARMTAIEVELKQRLRAMEDIEWHREYLFDFQWMQHVVGPRRFGRLFPGIVAWMMQAMGDLDDWARRVRKFHSVSNALRAATLPPFHAQLYRLGRWMDAVGDAEDYMWMMDLGETFLD